MYVVRDSGPVDPALAKGEEKWQKHHKKELKPIFFGYVLLGEFSLKCKTKLCNISI